MNLFANYLLFFSASLLDGIAWSSSWRSLYSTATSNESTSWRNNKKKWNSFFYKREQRKKSHTSWNKCYQFNFFLFLFFHWGFVSATNSYCIKTRYQQISGQLYAGKLFLALEKYILSQRNINFPGRFLSLKLETLPGHWYIKKPCEPALYFGMCHNVVMILMFLMPLLSQSNTKFEQKQEITVWLSIPFATFYTMYLVKNFFANRYWGNSWTTCGWHCVFPVPWE